MTPDELAQEQFNRVYRNLQTKHRSNANLPEPAKLAREARREELRKNLVRLEQLIEAADQSTRSLGVEMATNLELKVNEILQVEMPELEIGNYECSEISENFRVKGVIREVILNSRETHEGVYVKVLKGEKEIFRSSRNSMEFDFESGANELLTFEVVEGGMLVDKNIGNFRTYPGTFSRKKFPLTDGVGFVVLDMRQVEFLVLTFFASRVFVEEPGDYELTMEIFRIDVDGKIVTAMKRDLEILATEIDRWRYAADIWRGFEFRIGEDAAEISRFAAILWKKQSFGGTRLVREIINTEISRNKKTTSEVEMFLSRESEIWRGGEIVKKFPGRPRCRVRAEMSSSLGNFRLVAFDRFSGKLELARISDRAVDTVEEQTVSVALMDGNLFLRDFSVMKLPCQEVIKDMEISVAKFPIYRLFFRPSRAASGRFGDRKFHLETGDWMSIVICEGEQNSDLEISGRRFPDVKYFLAAHTEAPLAARYFRSHDDLSLDVTWMRCVEIGNFARFAEISVPCFPLRISGEAFGLRDGRSMAISVVTSPTHPEICLGEISVRVKVKQGDCFDLDVRSGSSERQTWLVMEEISDWKFPTFGRAERGFAALPIEVLQGKISVQLSRDLNVTFRNIRLVPWEEALLFESEIAQKRFPDQLELEVRVYFDEGDSPEFTTKTWLPIRPEFPISLGLCPPDFRLRCNLRSLDGTVRAVAGPVRVRLHAAAEISVFACGPANLLVRPLSDVAKKKDKDLDVTASTEIVPEPQRPPEKRKFVALEALMLPSASPMVAGRTVLRIFVMSAECTEISNARFQCQVCAYFLVQPAVTMAEARTSFADAEMASGRANFVFGEFLELPVPRADCVSLYLTMTTEQNQILGYIGVEFLAGVTKMNGKIQLTRRSAGDCFITLRTELSEDSIALVNFAC